MWSKALMKLYNVPENSLIKLSEGDGRVFKFLSVDQSFAYLRAENGTKLKLPSTYEVIPVGKYYD